MVVLGVGGGVSLSPDIRWSTTTTTNQANVLVPCAALKPGPAGPQGLVTMQA